MNTTVVVIGAGQAGLAMSWCLARRSIDHVVLERGEVANTWRTQRWDSLSLLTPNWQSRLPGMVYSGDDPDGYRTLAQTIAFIEDYAKRVAPPLRLGTTVRKISRHDYGYALVTDEGIWHCRAVVLASGAFNVPVVPKVAEAVPADIVQLTTDRYRNPAQLAEGGVLVVGAAASGAQIADELQRSGRRVTLAVGEHVRAPRVYRGKDIQWWMDVAGLNDERYDRIEDLARARSLPSFQLAGYPDRRDIDLNALTALGVRLVGKFVGVNDGKAQFSGSLRNVVELADLKMNRLLNTLDEWAAGAGRDGEVLPAERFAATRVEAAPPLVLDLRREGIRSIVWATGFRPDYSWLQIPVLDHKGNLRHDGGVVVQSPGLYALGLPFLRRRKSTLIDGVGDDAHEISAHLAAFLASRSTSPVTASVGA